MADWKHWQHSTQAHYLSPQKKSDHTIRNITMMMPCARHNTDYDPNISLPPGEDPRGRMRHRQQPQHALPVFGPRHFHFALLRSLPLQRAGPMPRFFITSAAPSDRRQRHRRPRATPRTVPTRRAPISVEACAGPRPVAPRDDGQRRCRSLESGNPRASKGPPQSKARAARPAGAISLIPFRHITCSMY
jgi:hypothetical protein